MNPLTLLLLLCAGAGLCLIGISIPLIQCRIKPNDWFALAQWHGGQERPWRNKRRPTLDRGRAFSL